MTPWMCTVRHQSIKSLCDYVSADEAGSVMDLLSLSCASAQDLAFLSTARQRLTCQMMFYVPC